MNGIVQQITNALFISAKPDAADIPPPNSTTTMMEPFNVKAGAIMGGMLLLYFIIMIAVYTAILLLNAFIAKYIWNAVVTDVFRDVKPIDSVWSMVGIIILSQMLIK